MQHNWEIKMSQGSKKKQKLQGGEDPSTPRATAGADGCKHVYSKSNHIYFYSSVTKENNTTHLHFVTVSLRKETCHIPGKKVL